MRERMRIALLRPAGRAEESERICEQNGFSAFVAPAIETRELQVDTEGLKQLLMRASVCVIMSRTAAEALLVRLHIPPSLLARKGLSVVSVGDATRHFLASHSIESVTPVTFSSEGVAELISSMEVVDGLVIVLRSNRGSSVLWDALTAKGFEVNEVALYGIVMPEDLSPLRKLLSELGKGERFVLPFSSSMMVRNFFAVAREVYDQGQLLSALEKCSVWAIGNETASEIRKQGLLHFEIAGTADYESMLREIFDSLVEQGA